MNGRVKYYNHLKGFGFVTDDAGGADWPVMAGPDTELDCGTEVEFDLVKAVYEGLEWQVARIRPIEHRQAAWESGARRRTDENLRSVFG